MAEEAASKSWWHTLPGVLTGIAGVIAAVTGLVAILNTAGLLPKKDSAPTRSATGPAANTDGGATKPVVVSAPPDKVASANPLPPPWGYVSRQLSSPNGNGNTAQLRSVYPKNGSPVRFGEDVEFRFVVGYDLESADRAKLGVHIHQFTGSGCAAGKSRSLGSTAYGFTVVSSGKGEAEVVVPWRVGQIKPGMTGPSTGSAGVEISFTAATQEIKYLTLFEETGACFDFVT